MSNTILKAKIEGIVTSGAGLVKINGKSVFIEGGIPGETVVCRTVREHRSWAQAELLEILEASSDRVRPVCDFYGICGGCSLQHLSYPAQLTAKTAILKDAFTHIGGFNPPEPTVSPSEPWEYRNRMQFHAIRRFDKRCPDAFCGLKARKSADIIPISDCPVADPGIRGLLMGRGKEARAFFVSPGKDRVTVYARQGALLSEGGVTQGRMTILGKELTLDARVFFQSNGTMLEKLVSDLREIVAGLSGPGGQLKIANLPMADLYCGVGTFAIFLGELFPHVDMVEENKAALALARENLASLGSANFYAKRIEDWAKNAPLNGYGFAIVDPPRQGLAPGLVQRLAGSGPQVLAYISCDPATLARDSKTLLGAYELADLRWYDFYPQTAHVESLALFIRK